MNESGRGSLRTYLLTIISLVIVIALLSAAGFYHFEHGRNETVQTYGDSLWWALVTMTTIGYGDIFPKTIGGRIVAVFLMFVGIGTLGVSTAAIAAYFVRSDSLQRLRLRRLRNHVVVCGLGEKGYLLTRAFRERGLTVVAIEENETNVLSEACRELGAIVLVGDAAEPEMLRKANVGSARYLIAVCGEDGKNAEVATRARELVENRKGNPLTCSAHIVDPDLWYLLRRWEISSVGAFRLQFFNVFDLGARAMLAAHPPFERVEGTPHLLVVGGGRLARNIVLHSVRLWREHRRGTERFRITVIDRTGDLLEELRPDDSGFASLCDPEILVMDVPSAEFHRGAFLYDEAKRVTVTAVYICLENDGASLSAGLALLHRFRQHPVPILLRMTQDSGLGALLESTQASGHGFEKLHPIGLLQRICQPEFVLGGANEALAHAIHARYLRDQHKAGVTGQQNPTLVPWEFLSEEWKESNRRQADDIGIKLRSIGCDIAPLTDWEASSFAFTPEEIERMAQMEHERWMAERRAAGWTFGPRDPDRKTNPNLVPWPELPEEGREFNRQTIRELPESLALAGFQVYRR
ncbi:MAG: NAD-binding protein [Capsulimonadales bacterium]|nr:NAD-binding protein [Capsulimonadales bacterium]